MRWKTQSLMAGVLTLAWAVPAHACSLWFNSTALRVPQKPTFSLGLAHISSFNIYAVDVALKAGDKVVVRPGVGECSGGGESNLVYGAAVGVNVFKDQTGNLSVNLQAGYEGDSYDGGSEHNIPVGASVAYTLNTGSSASSARPGLLAAAASKVTLYGGATINFYSDSYDYGEGSQDYSSTDKAFFGGAMFDTGNFTLTGGVTFWSYEGGSETAINVGAGMALGAASNMLRNLKSAFARN